MKLGGLILESHVLVRSKNKNFAESSNPWLDIAGKIGDRFASGKGQFLTAIKRSSPAQGNTIQFVRTI